MAMTRTRLAIEGDLTAQSAVFNRDRLRAFLDSGYELDLDLSCVTALDVAGLQLLLVVGREAAKTKRQLRLASPSTCITETLELVNLSPAMSGHVDG